MDDASRAPRVTLRIPKSFCQYYPVNPVRTLTRGMKPRVREIRNNPVASHGACSNGVKGEFITVEVSAGETVADLIKKAGLPEFEFGIVVVNGERELLSYQPKDGETLELLPIISGG